MPLQYNVTLFPDIVTFRKAIKHHAVIEDFEFANVRTDRTRFMANCAYPSCPWRIRASRLRDQQVVMVCFAYAVNICAFSHLSLMALIP